MSTQLREVLFMCVHNAGRSQMAAALLDRYAQGRVHVRSAGSDPADQINPAVVVAMSELGIDVSKEFPKPMTDLDGVRRIRDDIAERVRRLLNELEPAD
jgi:arsenate reductase